MENDELHACEAPPAPTASNGEVQAYILRTLHRVDRRGALDHDTVRRLKKAVEGGDGEIGLQTRVTRQEVWMRVVLGVLGAAGTGAATSSWWLPGV